MNWSISRDESPAPKLKPQSISRYLLIHLSSINRFKITTMQCFEKIAIHGREVTSFDFKMTVFDQIPIDANHDTTWRSMLQDIVICVKDRKYRRSEGKREKYIFFFSSALPSPPPASPPPAPETRAYFSTSRLPSVLKVMNRKIFRSEAILD